MSEYLFDCRLASGRSPEDNTARARGGDVPYTGRATRLGRTGTLAFAHDNPGPIGTDMSAGDIANILIRVPDAEHWLIRSVGLTTFAVASPGISRVAMSAHVWRARSNWVQSLSAWSNYDPNGSPPAPPLGLDPFVFRSRYWRQITAEREVPAVAGDFRYGQWSADIDLWAREVHAREIVLFRIQIIDAAATGRAALYPDVSIIRYPTAPAIIGRLTQQGAGHAPADMAFAALIESAHDSYSAGE